MKKKILRNVFIVLFMLSLIVAGCVAVLAEDTMAYNIYSYPDLSETSGKFDTFTIDFKGVQTPIHTYWALANFGLYFSPETYAAYPGISGGGAYAGLQDRGDGKKAIMSFWEMEYGDGKIMTASRVYPAGENTFGGEGEGTNCITGYNWSDNTWYRMVLHSWEDQETGTTFVGQWFRDLETGEWTLISYFDTHLYNSCMRGSMSLFQENYVAGVNVDEEREFQIKNIYAIDHKDGLWKSLDTTTLSYGDGGAANKSGGHSFGATNEYFWGVGGGSYSSGVKSQKYTISQPSTPTFDAPTISKLILRKSNGNWMAVWDMDEKGTPQLSYKIEAIDTDGNIICSDYRTRPEERAYIFDGVSEDAFKCRLTVTDIFGKQTSVIIPTAEYNGGKTPGSSISSMGGNLTDTVTWQYSSGVLTIDGVGNMPSYASDDLASRPWHDYSSVITKVVVKGTVTTVGERCFQGMTAMKTLILEEGVEEIKIDACTACTGLNIITFPASLKTIGQGVVWNTNNVKTVNYGGANKAAFEAIAKVNAYNYGTNNNGGFANVTTWNYNYVDPNRDADASGIGGQLNSSVMWSYSAGVLTIEGTGDMPNYMTEDDLVNRPWQSLVDKITKVIVKGGIDSTGNRAFSKMTAMKELVIEEGVEILNQDLCSYCTSLETLTIPKSVTFIGQGIVFGTNNIKNVNYGGKDAAEFEILSKKHAYNYGNATNDGVGGFANVTNWVYNYGNSVDDEKNIELTINPAFDGWENWTGSPNNPSGGVGITQLLLGVTLDGGKAPEEIFNNDIIWEITFTWMEENKVKSKSISLSPGTYDSWYNLIRFETVLGEGKNQFIPYKNQAYTVEVSFVIGNTTYHGKSGDYAFVVPMCPVVDGAVDEGYVYFEMSGKLTNTVNWQLYNGVLTISGTGAMPDYRGTSNVKPWADYSDLITKVVVKSGITHVGSEAFSRLLTLVEVVMEEGVSTIGMDAFAYCNGLKTMTLPSTITKINQGIVFATNNIETVNYGGESIDGLKAANGNAAYNGFLASETSGGFANVDVWNFNYGKSESIFTEDEDGLRYYYSDGSYAKGWATIDGKIYRFDPETGILFTESVLHGTLDYYFNADYSTVEGLVEEDGGLRFYKKGVRQISWADTDGDGKQDMYFYVSTALRCEMDRVLFDGVASRRFYKYNTETGSMEVVNGFYTNEKGTQYFINGIGKYGWITPEGEIITDRPGVTVYGAYYFTYGDGTVHYRVEGTSATIGGVTRVFDQDHLVVAYTGWAQSKKTGNPNYYVEGVLQQGWCLTPDGWVYLSRSENLANNISYGDVFYEWRKIGGKVYYFRASTSNPAYVLITDPTRNLNYNGVRSEYTINQTIITGTGADYYITNPPAGF